MERLVVPPIRHLNGACMAENYAKKVCSFYVDRELKPTLKTPLGQRTCVWSAWDKEQPMCEGPCGNCPRGPSKLK